MNDPNPLRRVVLVLDTSAVLAYTAGSVNVHELVLLAIEQDVAVPVLCLMEAVRRGTAHPLRARDRCRAPSVSLRELLHAEQIVTVMPDRSVDAALLADWTIYLDGREDAAAAAVVAYRCSAGLLTAEPDLYAIGGRRPEWIINVGGTW